MGATVMLKAPRREFHAYHGKVPIIVGEVRHRILDGTYSAGSRLPIRTELVRHFAVSSLTVQRAMRQLAQDGFVVSRGRGGSFIADHPPHLARYAVMFPFTRGSPDWSQWFEAALRGYKAMRRAGTSFFVVSGYDTAQGHEDYRNLVADVLAERVAGLIFTSDPHALAGTPVLDTPGLPRVGFMAEPIGNSVSAITLDFSMFVRRALDYLHAQGRKRPAVLLHSMVGVEAWEPFRSESKARGMECPTRWIHGVPLLQASWAEHIVQLLLAPGNTDRPDSLIVADDNLLEAASRAIASSGVRVPEDFTVVALANFPWPTSSCVPAKRFGLDIRDFFQTAVALIDAQRRQERVPRMSYLPIHEEKEEASRRRAATVVMTKWKT